MSHAERDFAKQIDDLILNASPQTLQKIAQIDKKAQMSGVTFYDVYSALTAEDRRQILGSDSLQKKNTFV
ncbi:MAG TPA: hypothetical protein VNK44_08640 [Candidatus Nitrosotenuis sp.]|nr:hypothetical protein [Candidatus Nitrosotenuis sp.]